ncbi:hypothetical protein GLYMA_06G265150v4 [Glycine max]|nr:hypothetical protein GLYMA_06G265150v4 [Glycine max]KAH1127770.1 hypothetical protein GYH30_016366 [Glycine max]
MYRCQSFMSLFSLQEISSYMLLCFQHALSAEHELFLGNFDFSHSCWSWGYLQYVVYIVTSLKFVTSSYFFFHFLKVLIEKLLQTNSISFSCVKMDIFRCLSHP